MTTTNATNTTMPLLFCSCGLHYYSMFLFLLPLLLTAAVCIADVNELGQESYEIDSSWAIRSNTLADTFGRGVKQRLYDNYLEACRAAVPKTDTSSCNDEFRLHMNTHQPMGMRNYTRLGFEKIRAPEKVFQLLKDFWETNQDQRYIEWKTTNVYHNMFQVPPEIVDLQNASLAGGGPELRRQIWDAAKHVLEEWTGQYLEPCSIWGIRIYHNDSILAPHVDRNPLVASAIINVAQDVDEEWPLEVWGHDGKPYNITMEPGDMVLYESHSLIHGRPFPLNGKYYANVFVHYEVVGSKSRSTGEYYLDDAGRESVDAELPPYILPNSTWADEWHDKNPDGWELFSPIDAHRAASKGDLDALKIQAALDKDELFEGDDNDWQPIHLASRAGHAHVVEFLLASGANVNAVTNNGRGWSPLHIAIENWGEAHQVSNVLRKAGGSALNPDDREL